MFSNVAFVNKSWNDACNYLFTFHHNTDSDL